MALRDKLRERSQPFLFEGERIEHIASAQAANPWMVGFGGGLFMLLFGKPRIIVATSASIVVLRQSKWSATPEEVLARLSRGTRIGPVSGLWSKSVVDGEQVWIHRRFHRDVEAMDGAVGTQVWTGLIEQVDPIE